MTYSTKAQSERIYGKSNILRWADMNNNEDEDEILDRIEWAIQEAYDQINARLKSCRYTVPFESPIDPVIITLSARLAGVLLYDNRRLVDIPEFDEALYHRTQVERMYKQIHGGQLSLLNYSHNAVSYPQAIATDSE